MNQVKNPKDNVRTKNSDAMATAFDAYAKTGKGTIVIEAKDIGKRVTEMRELAYSTIMEMTKTTHWYKKRFYELMKERRWGEKQTVKHPFDLFKAAKPILKEIAVKGGDDYRTTTMILQFTWSSRKTLTDTVNLILGNK